MQKIRQIFLNYLPLLRFKGKNMKEHYLNAITPIDGRYHDKTEELAAYFSESALFRYRLQVEVEYFIALCHLPLPELKEVPATGLQKLRQLYRSFKISDALKIKEIEKTTNHDVKAVEYFLKEAFEELGLGTFREFIHFGLTSQDINNTATPMLFFDALKEVYLPLLTELIHKLQALAQEWAEVPMLAHTHGQPASPTLVGKELMVFVARLEEQTSSLENIPKKAKFGGATGNFNAHHAAYPNIDWSKFADEFVNELGLTRSRPTTQIEWYDSLAAVFDNLKRINSILTDLCRDIWSYISMDYFKQKIITGEVGSSTMPHKINPIDFENAEGNLGIANAVYNFLSTKLPVSRLQRDLTDSTILRNTGLPVSWSVVAFKSCLKGLNKLILNKEKINFDLENNWNVLAEAIQTILRREGFPDPYETLKDLTRKHSTIDRQTLKDFVETLDIPARAKEELLQLTPWNYTGIKDY